MEEKQLRLGHLTWLENHARRASFLVTRAAPPLYFLPAMHCAATEALLAARQAESEAEAQQAADRLGAALASAAEAAAAKEAELLGKPRERDAVAEAEDVAAEPPSLKVRQEAEEAEDDEEVMDAADDDPLAGVMGVETRET
jgi:hypothetical protein